MPPPAAAVVKVHVLSEANALPATSFTPPEPPLIVAVYVVPAARSAPGFNIATLSVLLYVTAAGTVPDGDGLPPELLATAPNQCWSWDITKLPGPARGVYYDAYVMVDIYSRYIVGAHVHVTETAVLAEEMMREVFTIHGIPQVVHADRGTSMTSKPVAMLLADLGVTKSHSRPKVSNDNPYSESQFKTMKYRPEFPERFGCYQDAHRFCTEFFPWYNHEHHHSGLGYLTPYEVHYGLAQARREQRAGVLQEAFEKNPQRFVRGLPKPALLPTAAWINRPKEIPRTESTELLNTSINPHRAEKRLPQLPYNERSASG